jgi:hypothetical protein
MVDLGLLSSAIVMDFYTLGRLTQCFTVNYLLEAREFTEKRKDSCLMKIATCTKL